MSTTPAFKRQFEAEIARYEKKQNDRNFKAFLMTMAFLVGVYVIFPFVLLGVLFSGAYVYDVIYPPVPVDYSNIEYPSCAGLPGPRGPYGPKMAEFAEGESGACF